VSRRSDSGPGGGSLPIFGKGRFTLPPTVFPSTLPGPLSVVRSADAPLPSPPPQGRRGLRWRCHGLFTSPPEGEVGAERREGARRAARQERAMCGTKGHRWWVEEVDYGIGPI